ncbi:MAG TPA: futalosine hydrolase [Flavihumibacter sp.]|nr:futalosine hydrolase [Bacteroidota bacterium]HOA38433.1 futalosine hydrolase [Flavihumibacter sp.]HPZ87443.1 futalosine hydrolase [Flavihumibacter sp.]HQD10400.1 futalosine hydrolase [Flavihumibacter sp.]
MHCLLVAATAGEIAPFTDHLSQTDKLDHIELDIDILVTGVGAVATTYALTRYLRYKKPDLVIQAGVGGLFDRSKPLGTVFAIKQDLMADMGVVEKKEFKSLTDLGWVAANEMPYKKSVLVNPASTLLKRVKLPKANAITVNEISTNKERIHYYEQKYKALIESMEGAALHYVCLQENISFLQLRAASNYIGERNKKNWQLTTAINNLNAKLIQLLENL